MSHLQNIENMDPPTKVVTVAMNPPTPTIEVDPLTTIAVNTLVDMSISNGSGIPPKKTVINKKGNVTLPKNVDTSHKRKIWTQKLVSTNKRDNLFTFLYFIVQYRLDEPYRYVYSFQYNFISHIINII